MSPDGNREWSDRDCRLEVGKDGQAGRHDMSAPTGPECDQTLHCFFELWRQATNFVGSSVAADKSLVTKFALDPRENFPRLHNGQFVNIAT